MIISYTYIKCIEGSLEDVFQYTIKSIDEYWGDNKKVSVSITKDVDNNEIIVKYLDMGISLN